MFLPLPVKWMIHIHKPIHLDYPAERASDRKLVLHLARKVQYDIQRDLNRLLRERRSTLTGWDEESSSDQSDSTSKSASRPKPANN